MVREDARDRAPRDVRDGGQGAASIDFVVAQDKGNKSVVQVGWDRQHGFYMSFVELGTKFQRPQPHLVPALEENEDDIVDEMGRVFELAIEAARRA